MIQQQLIGVINLSLPLIILYQVYPAIFYTHPGIFICASIVGILVLLLNIRAIKNMVRVLQYSPTDIHKKLLETIVAECGMKSQNVHFLYAYTNEQIAIATFNSVILDPIIWSSIESDPEAIKVINIFEQFTAPTLSVVQKQRIGETKKIFSRDAQIFILKHELAHVHNHSSVKRLIAINIVGFLAAYVSILAAMSVLYINGVFAICAGWLVGCISDLLFTYLSNAIFKSKDEKSADLFAAHYSSKQEINAAADFFEQHQQIVDNHFDRNNLLLFLPSILTTGHPNGRTRARYLRAIVSYKK